MKSRRPVLALIAVTAALLLGGCGDVHPGVAAVAGTDRISHERVDQLAEALCSANTAAQLAAGNAKPDLPTVGARQSALQILLDTDLALQFGRSQGAKPDQQLAAAAKGQNEQGISMVPAAQRAGFRTVLDQYAESQLMLIDLGRKSLTASGETQIDENKALAEGHRLLSQWEKTIDVVVDPRYGTYRNGAVTAGDSSLSVAQSQAARQASKANSSAGFAATLPASQKCA